MVACRREPHMMILPAAVGCFMCRGCGTVGPSEGCQACSEACGYMWRTTPLLPTTLCACGHGMQVELKVKSGSPETTLERERGSWSRARLQ